MRERKWILISAFVGLLIAIVVVVCVGPFIAIFVSVARSVKEVKKVEAQLQTPEVYEPVAERLAVYCQSDQNLFPKSISGAWFPSELQKLGSGWGEIGNKSAGIEMGGGFHHFGYRLELAETTSSEGSQATNIWKLLMYSEGSEDKILTNYAVSASEHLNKEELKKFVEAGYDRLIVSYPKAYKEKVMSLIRFGDTNEATRVCNEWVNLQTNNWLPRFTLAHLRCRFGEAQAATTEYTSWTQSHQNFATCSYLALFNFREGNTNEAVKAVRLCLAQPFIEPPGSDGNKFYLGNNAAMIAYLAGDYDLCLAVCDKMLADSRNEEYWRPKVLQVRALALKAKDSQGAEPLPIDDHSWFTPYDTDEAGWHGTDDIPTPYPPAWKASSN
jgi:hypothetical protein